MTSLVLESKMVSVFMVVFVIVSLAHDPLVSTSSCTDEICYNGWMVKDRSGPDSAGWTMVSPDKEITCDGVVTQWRYQAKTSNSFRAVVWRPVPGSSTQFKIIGVTDIPAGSIDQEVIFNVPEDQRFPVRAGDVIGWSFGAGVLGYNTGGGHSVRWLGGSLQSSLAVDQIHNFDGGNGDREYSIMVAIDPVTGGKQLTGWPIRSRGGPDSAGWTMVSVETTFNCGGFVTEWHYQAKADHPIRAIIFRQASPLQYSIVGINDIPAGGQINKRVVFEVPLNDRIKVQRGDMIGWSFGPGVLDYKSEGNTRVRWVGGNLHASLGQGQLISIDEGSGNRRYAIAAMMKVYEDSGSGSGSECTGQMITTKDNKGQEIRQGKPQPIGSDAVNVIIQSPPGRDGRDGEAGPPGPPGTPAPDTGTGSTVYTRWGRTECPSSASLVYAGMAGGKSFTHTGSGSNYLCLPTDPEYDDYEAGTDNWRGIVYSAEYEITAGFTPFAGKQNQEVPCAVCRTANRGSVVTIPAKMTCPSSWTKEYHGYLVSEYHGRPSSTEFVCMDRNPENAAGSSAADDGGAYFYPVESRCDSGKLPCAPYINGAELTCVVCTK